jgi:HAE1 family hydrophobic/amphiphilic exporter-1
LWLRRPVPLPQRNAVYRAFNLVYDRVERRYAALIDRLTANSGTMAAVALLLIGVAGYGFMRIPAGFLPIEDQGYLLASVQLPDGASLERTQKVLDRVTAIAHKTAGVAQVVTIAGISVLDNSASLANAGVAYIILKPWNERGAGEDLRALFVGLNQSLGEIENARTLVVPPPPIQGIGNAAGVTLQIELRDSSFDLTKLQASVDGFVANAGAQSSLQRVQSTFRSGAPQYLVRVDRVKAETLHVSLDQVFSALAGYVGSGYVDQFNKFGRTFEIIVQADKQYRLRLQDIANLTVRSQDGHIIPLGTLVSITPTVGSSLISLYDLYPSATVIAVPAAGVSTGQAMQLLDAIAARTLPPGSGFEWTAMSYQEKIVGNQMYFVFGMALLLVYLVLAGQYESWLTPVAVILAVPLAIIGPVLVLIALKIENNLYVQIGVMLLIALSAKNAILIVEVARERYAEGASACDAAIEGARARFRPILMTSIAFIFSVVPLVLATGAGANARKSIGITVFSGMIASTCLAVLFVPVFFVMAQRVVEWRVPRRRQPVATGPVE